MDVPFAALFSASRTCRGSMFVRAEAGDFVGGSFELQLETAIANSNPKAITVVTSRSGVQNFIFLTSFFRSDIFHFFLPNLNESRITGISPFTPTSSTDDNSPARFVPNIIKVAPVVSPSFPVGRKTARPHKLRSPRSVPFASPSHLNSYASIEFTLVGLSDTFL